MQKKEDQAKLGTSYGPLCCTGLRLAMPGGILRVWAESIGGFTGDLLL